MSSKKAFLENVAVLWGYGCAVLVLVLWVMAYANPTDSVSVSINRFGEKYPELILWALVVPILTVGLHYYIERTMK